MYNIPCTTAQLLYVKLMENGPVSSSASLKNSSMFQLILHTKTALRSLVYYWRHTNSCLLSMAVMKTREWHQRNYERRLQSSWDSVEKNPLIENFIATTLGSSYIPFHLLCKAHTVGALDISNISDLAHLGSSLKFREAPESINAGVKLFVKNCSLVCHQVNSQLL